MLFYYETEDKLEYTKCTTIRISCAASTLDKLVSFNSEQHKLGMRVHRVLCEKAYTVHLCEIQNQETAPVVSAIRTMATLGIEISRKYCKGLYWGRGKVSSLDLSTGYMNVPTL